MATDIAEMLRPATWNPAVSMPAFRAATDEGLADVNARCASPPPPSAVGFAFRLYGVRRLGVALAGALALALAVSASADVIPLDEGFDGPGLGAAWTIWDGYAVAVPGDAGNFAQFSVANSRLSISFPAGAEHNMWWLRHAQVTRAFEGTGVYEVKVDSSLDGNQQFGLVFESGPGNVPDLHAVCAWQGLGVHRTLRQHRRGSQLQAHLPRAYSMGTTPGLMSPTLGHTGFASASPTIRRRPARTWKFQWSVDGANWTTVWNGPLEAESGDQNIGAIQRVGVFAGNQPELFSAFDARFDYFRAYPFTALPIDPPVGLTAAPGDREVALSWGPVTGAIGYRLYRREGAGPYVRVHEGIGDRVHGHGAGKRDDLRLCGDGVRRDAGIVVFGRRFSDT